MDVDPDVADIDLNDPEVQKAATRIQAGFRGHQTRKVMKDKQPEDEQEHINEDLADIDLTDPDLADAALKIQAGFRGHKARKEIKKTDEDSDISKRMEELQTEDELADIDLGDPELNKAATKIQATFRGHKSRKTD